MSFYDNPTHVDEDSSLVNNDHESAEGDGPVPSQDLTADVEQECKQELKACMKDVEDLKETCKRVAADFENFKKRVERDRVTWTQSAQAEVLRDLLPVIYDFDRAISEYQKREGQVEHESWIAGFELIRKSLNKLLQTYGVTVIEQMTHFDPEFHEALSQIESPNHQSGSIVEIVNKGYMFNKHLLRPARVIVAK